jgi:sterol desaturase/sphingolipid hydroxylase (fatty acid hydroxylase superfamily)
MNTREYLSSVAIILAVMATVSVIEAVVPLFARPEGLPGRRRANLAMTFVTLLFAFALTSGVALAALYLPLSSPGLMSVVGLPVLAQLAIGVVVADFAYGYLAHWLMHASPRLWRFHRVHHSDPFVDVTTSYRTHPVENAWRHLWLFAAVWVLGIPAAAVVTFRVLSAVNGILEHANVRVRPAIDTFVSLVWVTPNMHKVHHSRDKAETNANYGNLFTLHDRLFRTFVPTVRAFSVKYGLDDVDPTETRSVAALLAMPWRFDRRTRHEDRMGTSLNVGGSR